MAPQYTSAQRQNFVNGAKSTLDQNKPKWAVQPNNDFINGAKSYSNPLLDQWGNIKKSSYQSASTNSSGNFDSGDNSSDFNPNDYDVETRMREILDPMNKSNEQTYNELMELAKGDYDMVAKWLEKAYTNATGSDAEGRKAFIAKIANSLEEKIGTIAYDYETGKYRTEEDMKIGTGRANDDRTEALKRLSEDDATYKDQYQKQAIQDRRTTGEAVNARGFLNGKYDEKTGESGITGVGSINVNELEGSIQDKFDALERATARSGKDINQTADRSIEDINLTGNRTLDDLKTTARRDTWNETYNRDYGLDKADQARKARERELAIQKREADNAAARLARQTALLESNGVNG